MAKVVDEITFRFYSPEDLPESGRKVLAYLKGGELVSGATTSKRYFFTGGDSEAVHEFTHHVLTTEKGVKTTKAHSGAFWATFYDFLDKAIKEGFYTRNRNSKTQELITQAKDIQKSLIELQKQLGAVLNKLHEVCKEEGERVEDVIESDLQMSRNKAKELQRMAVSNGDFSDEMTKTISSAKDVMLAKKAAEDGKTVEQVKAIAKKTKPVDDDLESPEQLRREKKRLETTIERLNDRLVQVEETLASMNE